MAKQVAWVIPFPLEGSGGHRTIFQNVETLCKNGYECDVYVQPYNNETTESLRNHVERCFGKLKANFYMGLDFNKEYDLMFATSFSTTETVRLAKAKHKAYFIQDYEVLFHSMGDEYIQTENSYRFGFTAITIGRWLANKMQEKYNSKVDFFNFCADTNVYKPLENVQKEKAICFVYQPEKPRRCNKIGMQALKLVKHVCPDVKIYLYGSKHVGDIPFECKNLGIVTIDKCNELYNKCMVGLCMSSSNPSRIPFEMMASGLPVVELYLENNLYDMPDGATLLTEPTVESIAAGLLKVLNDEELQNEMSRNGKEFMKDYPLEKGFEQFLQAVNSIFEEKKLENIRKIDKTYNKQAIIADEKLKELALKVTTPIFYVPPQLINNVNNTNVNPNHTKYTNFFPENSKRRKIAKCIYRFPRYLKGEYIKKAWNRLKKNGPKDLITTTKNFLLKDNIVNNVGIVEEKDNYNSWILNNEPNEEELNNQKKFKFEYNPKISVIVPMYNTPINFFKELVCNMINQTYSNWELCLGDGSPEQNEKFKEIIKDERIKYTFIGENKGISGNTNEALNLATGDYVALLDHDDLLPVFALFEVVKAINENKDAEFLYSDEDKIDETSSIRYDPHFKPDFAIDTLRSYNYICHLSIFKSELIKGIGGFRSECDGSQDYDIIIRATEKAKKIIHIPKILYHWRSHLASTANNGEAKPYCYTAAKLALKEHFERQNIKAQISDGKFLGTYRIDYKFEGNPKVSIIIPNRDEIESLTKCLDSINKLSYSNIEIIIVENNSVNPETFEFYNQISKDEKIKIIYYKELGFNYSAIVNRGVREASGDYLLLLNNDTEFITQDALEQMLGFACRNDVGIVGSKLLFNDDTIQHAGVIIGIRGIAGHAFYDLPKDSYGYIGRANVIQNLNAVTAACFMVKKELFYKVNGFAEDLPVNFNDVDFCLKVRQTGKLIIYTPFVELYHYESKSRGKDDTKEKEERFQKEVKVFQSRWNKLLEKGDEYYNKNFTLDDTNFTIKRGKI